MSLADKYYKVFDIHWGDYVKIYETLDGTLVSFCPLITLSERSAWHGARDCRSSYCGALSLHYGATVWFIKSESLAFKGGFCCAILSLLLFGERAIISVAQS